jgi:hypothetical protein
LAASKTWRELTLHYFLVDCFGGSQFGGEGQTIFTDSRLSEIWRELAPHYFPVDCFWMEAANLVVTDRQFLWTEGYLRFGGNWLYF